MKRKYSTYTIQRRATRRAQDAADDAFYAEQARRRREAEAAAQQAEPAALARVEHEHSEDGHHD